LPITLKKGLYAGLAATAVAVGGFTAPAFAASVTSPSSPAVVTNNSGGYPIPVTFDTSGWTPLSQVFAMVCDGKSPSDPTFSVSSDCDSDTQVAITVDANGNANFLAAPADNDNFSVPLFHGVGPADFFNCLAPGDNPNGTETAIGTTTGDKGFTGTDPRGGLTDAAGSLTIDPTVPSYGASTVGTAGGGTSPCTIRFSNSAETATAADVYIPLSLTNTVPTGPGTTVPESPLAILLPIGGVVLLGGAGFFMTRKRRSSHAA
jgi:hypothetical protein